MCFDPHSNSILPASFQYSLILMVDCSMYQVGAPRVPCIHFPAVWRIRRDLPIRYHNRKGPEIAQRFDVLVLKNNHHWILLDCECRNSVVPVKILCWLSNIAEFILFVSNPTRHVNTFCLHVSCGHSIAGAGIQDHDNKWILRASRPQYEISLG